MTATTAAPPPLEAAPGNRQAMPREVGGLAWWHDASPEPLGNARHDGDASVLAVLGLFALIDGLLVVLWNLL